MIWVAAKVFRTGILMYGKRPGLREVVRWLSRAWDCHGRLRWPRNDKLLVWAL